MSEKRAERKKRGLRCPKCGAPLYVRETIPLYSGEKIVRVYERCECGADGITSTESLDQRRHTLDPYNQLS